MKLTCPTSVPRHQVIAPLSGLLCFHLEGKCDRFFLSFRWLTMAISNPPLHHFVPTIARPRHHCGVYLCLRSDQRSRNISQAPSISSNHHLQSSSCLVVFPLNTLL